MTDSTYDRTLAQIAQTDFDRARRKAFFNELEAVLMRRPSSLVSFEEVEKLIPIQGQYYKGVQQVPVSSIVGSVNRYRDFDREFLPTQSFTRPRWESVDMARLTDVTLPPVQLYKVDSAYFVKDGNHRVSVAREMGMDYIDAEVIECATRVPIANIMDQQALLRLAEYARFLEQTQLDRLRPGVKIEFTSLGRYDTLFEHISAHRWYMGIDQKRPIEWEEAVLDWYDHIYAPVIHAIRENRILDKFPRHTEADLYLWIMDHRWYLREDTGQDVGPQTAVLSYTAVNAGWTRKVVRFLRRLHQSATKPLTITAQRIARAMRASTPEAGSPER
jgi:hypothetical protein